MYFVDTNIGVLHIEAGDVALHYSLGFFLQIAMRVSQENKKNQDAEFLKVFLFWKSGKINLNYTEKCSSQGKGKK